MRQSETTDHNRSFFMTFGILSELFFRYFRMGGLWKVASVGSVRYMQYKYRKVFLFVERYVYDEKQDKHNIQLIMAIREFLFSCSHTKNVNLTPSLFKC